MKDLKQLLDQATWDQRRPLVQILDTKLCQIATTSDIIKGVQWLHRNLFEDFYRDVFGESEAYADVLCTLLKRLGVKASSGLGCEALEVMLTKKVFGDVWNNMSAKQRHEFSNNAAEMANRLGMSGEWKQVGGVAGALVLANMGGFGTYLLASTVLASITSVVGLTLPFAIYTTLSSGIATLLGPVGWVGALIFGVYKLTGTNYKKLISGALYIAVLRYELGTGSALPSTRGMRLL